MIISSQSRLILIPILYYSYSDCFKLHPMMPAFSQIYSNTYYLSRKYYKQIWASMLPDDSDEKVEGEDFVSYMLVIWENPLKQQ